MPRGIHHATSLDEASLRFQQFFGRIEERIILFAAEVGISADRVAERVATLLSPQREGVLDYLPAMQREAARVRGELEPLALAEHAHSSQAPVALEARRAGGDGQTAVARTRQHHTPEGLAAISEGQRRRWAKNGGSSASASPAKTAQSAYWSSMSAEERSKEMARRRRKWSAEARAKWKGAKGKKQAGAKAAPARGKAASAKPKVAADELARRERQRIYQARAVALKKGLPQPPLPGSAPGSAPSPALQ